MRSSKRFSNLLPRVAVIILAMLFGAGNLHLTHAAGPAPTARNSPGLGAPVQEATNPVHRSLGSVGLSPGQTLRINVVNSPDPNAADPPDPIHVVMEFHDANGNVILDRARRPIQKVSTLEPNHGDFLDINGNALPGGGRLVIIPCIRVLSISGGTMVVPTLEMYNNLLKTTVVLSPGTARGFEPKPEPPMPVDLSFGLVGLSQGVTARLYVHNAQNPRFVDPPDPVLVELTFHDANGNVIVSRGGHQARKLVTLTADHVDFLELDGNEVAGFLGRVGIIPSVRVVRGSPTSMVTPTFEMYINFTQDTLLLINWGSPPEPESPGLPQ